MYCCWIAWTALVASLLISSPSRGEHAGNWPQWRGPQANGVAPDAQPPLTWNATTNIKWRTPIPGGGSATPIVWENQIFVAAAIPTERVAPERPRAAATAKTQPPENFYRYVVISLDRNSGKPLWQSVACEAVPHEGRHPTNSFASASPTTDGRRLYVSFGSRGIFCFDLHGKLLWQRDLGDMRTRYGWGEATSPVVRDESLIINWDHEDQSFITILDAATGETRWKRERDEPTTWATPLVVEHAGRLQVVVNGTNRVRSYDLADGEIIWQCGGQTVNAIPTPIAAGEVVFCMSGYRGSAAYALPLHATGDLTDTQLPLWTHSQGTPYVPSPIIYGRQIYFTARNTSVLSCLDLETGQPVFAPQRIPGLKNLYASPVAATGRLYFTDRDGTTVVLQHGPRLEVLATNRLDEPIDASPALAGEELFLRSTKAIYCITEASRQ